MWIGNIVRSINPNGAVKTAGKLMGIVDANWFLKEMSHVTTEKQLTKAWSIYPDWKEKPVGLVCFEEPQKIATLAEWVEGAEAMGVPRGQAVEQYADCPKVKQLAFPLDDLEVVEDDQ